MGVRAAGQKGQQCARAWEGSGVRHACACKWELPTATKASLADLKIYAFLSLECIKSRLLQEGICGEYFKIVLIISAGQTSYYLGR